MTKSYWKHLRPTPLLLAFLILLTLLPGTVAAQDNSSIQMTVQAGYDSYYRQNAWIPVTVTVANSGSPIEGDLYIEVGSSFAGDSRAFSAPISLPTQSNKVVTLYVYLDRFTSNLAVALRDDNGRTVTSATSPTMSLVNTDDLFYAVVTDTPGELTFLENVTGTRSDAAVAYMQLENLPAAPAAWQMIDILIINNVDSSTLTSSQLANLNYWLELGGQLVITGGPDWQPTSAAFTDLLPVAINGTQSIADLPALTTTTGDALRDPGPYLVADARLTTGELLLHQDGLPLLAYRESGKGGVYFLALDPNLAPLLDWDGSEKVWAMVADAHSRLPVWADGAQNAWTAASAVSRLPSLTLPSVLQLILFLLAYTAVMGPGVYIVLKRRQRLEMAWVVFPIIVIAFTAVSYITGFQLRGNNTIINQMSVSYGELGGDTLRTQTLIGLYSPRRTSYSLSLPNDTLIRPFAGNAGDNISLDAIQYGTTNTLDNIRLDIGEVGTFVANHATTGPDISGQISMSIDGGLLTVDIAITNNSDLLLDPATLLIAGNAITLGAIAPGETINASNTLSTAPVSTSPTPGGPVPIFSPGTTVGAPLTSNATQILGTSNYYDDRDIYPRWELLQAIESNPNGGGIITMPTDTATFIAWAKTPQIDIALNTNDSIDSNDVTLFLLEVPFERNLVQQGEVLLPAGLLNWRTVEQVNVYDASIYNFYLNNGRVVYEYTPWPEFQQMAISDMTIVLNSSDAGYTFAPTISLWDWENQNWDVLPDGDWGNTAVSNPTPYLNSSNTIRIQLESNASDSGAYINEIYPQLTGTISE